MAGILLMEDGVAKPVHQGMVGWRNGLYEEVTLDDLAAKYNVHIAVAFDRDIAEFVTTTDPVRVYVFQFEPRLPSINAYINSKGKNATRFIWDEEKLAWDRIG